jgi:hypothetical protein
MIEARSVFRRRRFQRAKAHLAFAHRHRALLAGNQRTARAVQGLDRLGDVDEVLHTDRRFDEGPP